MLCIRHLGTGGLYPRALLAAAAAAAACIKN